jgi:hypothetical protein
MTTKSVYPPPLLARLSIRIPPEPEKAGDEALPSTLSTRTARETTDDN